MRPRVLAPLLVALLTTSVLGGVSAVTGGAHASAPAATNPVTGSITGKSVLAYHTSAVYSVRGSGGPAELPNGTFVGNLSFYLSVSGTNTTNVAIAPTQGKIVNGAAANTTLTVANVSEVLTISVLLASTTNTSNESTNFSTTVTVVQPYVLSTTIYNLGNTTVTSFPIAVDLDGTLVGTVSAPQMLPHSTYAFSYSYPTVGLSAGEHTFTIYLPSNHGLVRFANGTTTYSVSFYIPGPPPDYTIWYVAGAVAFVGALFIFAARVGARRRTAAKK
jgi:hypothetical protein